MRRESRIAAIVIGIVVIGLAVWYGRPTDPAETDKPDQNIANKQQTGDSSLATNDSPDKNTDKTNQAVPTINRKDRLSENVASPTPVQLQDAAKRSFRPQAVDTPDGSDTGYVTLPDQNKANTPAAGTDASRPRDLQTGFAAGGATSRPAAEQRRIATTRPAAAPVAKALAAKPQPAGKKVHVVAPNDTFSAMAVKYYGDAKYASLIVKANPGVDPRRLAVGAKMNIPAAPEAKPVAAASTASPVVSNMSASPSQTPKAAPAPSPIPAGRSYKVQPGEGWYGLAKKFLGDANRWPELYELNRERVTRDPNQLRAGTVIELPAGVKPVESAKK